MFENSRVKGIVSDAGSSRVPPPLRLLLLLHFAFREVLVVLPVNFTTLYFLELGLAVRIDQVRHLVGLCEYGIEEERVRRKLEF